MKGAMRSRRRRAGIGATLHPHADTLRVMDLGLEGKVALVTGASQGIGFGIAQELAREGTRVAVGSRTREKIEAAAAQIGARPYVHDTVELDAAPELLEGVERDLGPIDILVTNTGGPAGGAPRAGRRADRDDRARGARDARAPLWPRGERLLIGGPRADSDADALQLTPAGPPGRVQDAGPQAGRRRRHVQHAPARSHRHRPDHAPARLDRGGTEGRA